MSDATERLRTTLERLERERQDRADQLRASSRFADDPPPDAFWQDSNGRSILLDADVALVNGWAALVRAES